ncbi:hypothetical protein CVIRNUC_001989 [Coccomyxa viridis]|uniref:protein disulfide-isomerase n=1 Tax=Coccomyxa viridis TaxID=1274662 RepID=A0AAV1HUX1_9CHLO|nr:hypothetical protein CVIRNUC_001989 [Coccomyxa viridis]
MLVLLSVLAVAHGIYGGSGPVLSVNKKDFKAVILESSLPAVVEFYAPWCGHCQQLAPTYTKVAKNLQGMVTVAAVDCDEDSNKKLCGKYGVKGFPTIKMFPALAKANPYTGKMEKSPTDYQGPRSAKAMADSALALLLDTFITNLKGAAAFEKFRDASEAPKVILASTKPRATPLYKSLSLAFRGRLAFALVRDSETDILSSLEISEPPALVVILPEGETIKYEGSMKAKDLTAFLNRYALATPVKETKAGAKDDTEQPHAKTDNKEDANEKALPQVVADMTFEELEAASTAEDALLVAFVKGKEAESCKDKVAELNKIVAELGPLIKAAQIVVGDAASAQAKQYGLDGDKLGIDPCALDIVLLPFDEDKGSPEDWQHYAGDLSSKELQKFVLEAFPSFVTRVTASTMQQFMGADMATPHVFLFTDKEETPAVYAALSVNLRKYKYKFGEVHSGEAALMQQFNVKKVPSMAVSYVKPGTEEEFVKEGKLGIQVFPGPLKYPYMHTFLTTFAGMMGALPEGEADPMDFMERTRTQSKADKSAPAADVPQASTQTELYESCLRRSSGLCVLALLDASSASHAQHAKITSEAAGRWGRQPLHFSWIDAARQPSFISTFGLSKTDLPTLVAFHPKKLRGASLRASFSAESIDALLDGLFSGSIHSEAFQELPALVEGGEEDSADLDPIEEEFDLADVLGEDVGGSGSKEDLLKQAEMELEEEERQRAEKEAAEMAAAAGQKKKSSKRRKKKKAKASKDEL